MKLEFRIALDEDLADIINLCNLCFDENTELSYAKKIWDLTKADPNQIYLVGLLDGVIVAHAKITVIPTIYQKMNTYAILNHVCVNPENRRGHIATNLLKECEKICKEKGCVCMELWSMNFRQPAHSCYLHYGFNIDDAKFFSKEIV